MKSGTLTRGTSPAELGQNRTARSSRFEDDQSQALNPLLGWSIALLISAGLWWGIWLTAYALASALF